MKKVISLLAVALFATVFAAGCGKPTECSKATTKKDCVTEADKFFADDSKLAGKCKWDPDTKAPAAEQDTKGTCKAKYVPETADHTKCNPATAPGGQPDCTAKHATLSADDQAKFECKFVAATGTEPAKCVAEGL